MHTNQIPTSALATIALFLLFAAGCDPQWGAFDSAEAERNGDEVTFRLSGNYDTTNNFNVIGPDGTVHFSGPPTSSSSIEFTLPFPPGETILRVENSTCGAMEIGTESVTVP